MSAFSQMLSMQMSGDKEVDKFIGHKTKKKTETPKVTKEQSSDEAKQPINDNDDRGWCKKVKKYRKKKRDIPDVDGIRPINTKHRDAIINGFTCQLYAPNPVEKYNNKQHGKPKRLVHIVRLDTYVKIYPELQHGINMFLTDQLILNAKTNNGKISLADGDTTYNWTPMENVQVYYYKNDFAVGFLYGIGYINTNNLHGKLDDSIRKLTSFFIDVINVFKKLIPEPIEEEPQPQPQPADDEPQPQSAEEESQPTKEEESDEVVVIEAPLSTVVEKKKNSPFGITWDDMMNDNSDDDDDSDDY